MQPSNDMVPGLVSTIIPVYNRRDMIDTAIQSVLKQSYRPIEILLIDDGSTDDTLSVLQQLEQEHPETVRVFSHKNSGPGAARELGRQHAIGEFIQYLDSDDHLLPGKFEIQVQALQNNPDCDIAYGVTRLVDGNGKVLKDPYKRSHEKHTELFPQLLVDRWWNTLTPLYRRTLCDRIGAWPPNRMGEDWQYDAKAAGLGVKLAFCNVYVAEQVCHDSHRLTAGELTPQKLLDLSDVVLTLYENARLAVIPRTLPEMQHLSRWAFAMSRQMAILGNAARAQQCLAVASDLDEASGAGWDYRLFRILTMVLGWKNAAKLINACSELRSQRTGKKTLAQSWSEQELVANR